MSFSITVPCDTRAKRAQAFDFLSQVDWDSVVSAHPKWAGTQMVKGEKLLYIPFERKDTSVGFNVPHVNNLALAMAAWLATRVSSAWPLPKIYIDSKPLKIRVDGSIPYVPREKEYGYDLDSDDQGILTFSHESLLERALSFVEHQQIREFLLELSWPWPLRMEPVIPKTKRGIGPR